MYKYKNVDSNDEKEVKSIIASEIKPYFDAGSKTYKESLKRTLAYFLTTGNIDFETLYDSCSIAFDHHGPGRLFFIWIWEVLFPNEKYIQDTVEGYEELEDINEPVNHWKSTLK